MVYSPGVPSERIKFHIGLGSAKVEVNFVRLRTLTF